MAYSKWINNGNRQGGEYNSGNLTVPVGIDTVNVRLDVNEADFATPDRRVTISVSISTDGAATWRDLLRAGWVGAVLEPPPPGKPVGWYAAISGVSRYAGALVRVHISSTGTFRWGISGELVA